MKKQQLKDITKDDDKFKWFVVENLFKMESRLSRLEVKSGVWGAVGGVFTVSIALGIYYLKKLGS